MPQPLFVLHDDPLDGPTNMARDEHLLYAPALRPAVVRFYRWTPPTLSLGYFQRFEEVARLPEDVRDLAVVRRLTGGGAILHDREITYSLVLDDSLPITGQAPLALYRLVHECWRAALAHDGPAAELAPDHFPMPSPRSGPFFCFEKPGKTDLLVGGVKLLGSAQRRIPGRVLQHGSLLLEQRFRSHPGANLGPQASDHAARWTAEFIQRLADALDLRPEPTQWSPAQLPDVAQRRTRYASDEWTRGRVRFSS